MYTTYEPRPEHLGPGMKPNFTGASKHLGFNEAADAVYKLGQDFSDSLKEAIPKPKHVWTAANLFAGINPEPLETLSTVRDGLATATAALNLVVEVLQAIEELANLAANVLNILIEQIINILRAIASLFNPSIAANLLFIPPKIGKVTNPDLIKGEDPANDSPGLRIAKKSELARQTAIDYINSANNLLPSILGDTATQVKNDSAGFNGGAYLQKTILNKLSDKADLSRPCINEYSYWAGAGIFLGTNSINKLLDAWARLNAILNADLAFRRPVAPGLPPKPVIKEHRVTETAGLKCASESNSVSLGPAQRSVIVAPLLPTDGIYGSIEYTFEYRITFITASFLNTTLGPASAVQPDIAEGTRQYNLLVNYLTEQKYIQATDNSELYNLDTLNVFSEYRYTGILLEPYLIQQDTGSEELFNDPEGGFVLLASADIYSFGEKGKDPQYLARLSEPTYAFIKGTDRQDLIPGLLQYTLPQSKTDLFSPTGKSPKWVSATAVLHILPDAIREILNFFDLLETFLKTLIAEALAWISRIIAELQSILDFLLRLVETIDRVIQLLQDLLSLTTSLGASVMVFNGNGPVSELEEMFKDYFALDSSSPASISKLTTSIPPREPISLSAEDLVKGTDEDTKGSLSQVIKEKKQYQRELQRAQRNNTNIQGQTGGDWEQQSFNGGAMLSSTGKTSPVFTDDATTCGVLIMGHSDSYGNLQALIAFLDFLFGSEDKAVSKSEADTLKEADLEVQTKNLFPQDTGIVSEEVLNPIFKSNMEVTEDPNQSPFNFCPHD